MRRLLSVAFAGVIGLSTHAAAAPPPVFATELPFRDCDGLICIRAELDGEKARTLFLDLGDPGSVLLTDAAKSIGWTLRPVERNGKTRAGIFDGGEHRVVLGTLQARHSFTVIDRKLLGDHRPHADGSIAYEFFKDRILQIDYPHHRLRISNVIDTPAVAADGTAKLELITFGKHGPPIVVGSGFSVNGKPLRAQIDTAYTGTLLIYDPAVPALGLTKQGAPTFFGYTDGGVNMLAGSAQSIGFGTQTLAKDPILYFVGEGSNPVHQPDGLFEGTVGNALFAHSVVTLDFHAMTLDVQPAG